MEFDGVITSTSNPRVKTLAKLRAGRRDDSDHILIDGLREIARAAVAGLELVEAYYCPALANAEATAAMGLCRKNGAKCIEVNEPVLEKINYGDRRDGLVVTAVRPRRRLTELKLSPASLVAVLEGIEKPGNLGAILRSADAAGVDAIIIADAATDLYGPNVIRASTGIVFSMPVYEASAPEVRSVLQSRSVQLVAAAPEARLLYTDVDFRKPTAVILGSEAKGLSSTWRDSAVVATRIPMLGKADSLNVATTAALFFYEARRQRGMLE